MASKKKSVLFICLGNICRSPMAEAVFLDFLEKESKMAEWEVDSAALGAWHVGKGPDGRTMSTLAKNGIANYKHKARELTVDDFTHYDYIFGMDDDNMSELDDRKPSNSTTKLVRLGEFDPKEEITIRDPYYDSRSDNSGFEKVYEQCVRCCKSFLDKRP